MARPLRSAVRNRITSGRLTDRLRGNFAGKPRAYAAIVAGRNLVNIEGQLYPAQGLEEAEIGAAVTVQNVGRPAAAVYAPSSGSLTGRPAGTSAASGVADSASAEGGTHNHDLLYAPLVHNHDAVYSPIGHDHDADYSAIGHTHSAYINRDGSVQLTDDWDIGSGRKISLASLWARDANGLGLYDDGGNLGLKVADGGKVGIGEASPAYQLHVKTTEGGIIRAERTATVIATLNLGVYSNPGGLTGFTGGYIGSSDDLGLSAANDLHLAAGAAQAAILTSGGDLGVGTTSPFNSRIEAYKNIAGGLRISINNPNAAGSSILQFFEGGNYQGRVYYTNADDYLIIQNDQGSGIIKLLGPSGAVPLVGIGAATPTHNLHIEDPAGGTTTLKVSDGSNVAYLQVGVTGAGARLILDNNDANQDRWDITTGITNGRLTFVNDDNSLNAVEIASNGLLLPHYGIRVANKIFTSDDQYEVTFFGDGTNAQSGAYNGQISIMGGSGQTRKMYLKQNVSGKAEIGSTYEGIDFSIPSSRSFNWGINATEIARIDATGLGLGNVAPQGRIHAAQNGGQKIFKGLSGVNGTPQNVITGSWVAFAGVASIKDNLGNGAANYIRFSASGSDVVSIDASNRVEFSISSGNVQVARLSGTRTYTVSVEGVVA